MFLTVCNNNKFAIFLVIILHIIVLTSQFPEERTLKRLKKDNTGSSLEGDEDNSGGADEVHGSPEQDQLVEDENGQDEAGGDEKTDEDYEGAGEEQIGDGGDGDIVISDRGGYRNRRPHHGYQPYYPPPRQEVITIIKGNCYLSL